MNELVKRVKKLSPKKGNIIIVTLKGYPSDYDMVRVTEMFADMKFLKGVNVIFVNERIKIESEKPQKGKHKVYLNNLEYLEFLSKRKGETE
jgi:hypothetical protein